MAAYVWTLEPNGTSLDVTDNSAYFLLAQDVTPPPLDAQYVGSVDSDGDALVSVRHQNRVVRLTIRVVGSTAAELEDRVQALQAVVGKWNREQGEARLTTPASTTVTFDVLTASVSVTLDRRYQTINVAQCELEMTCKPYGRGVEEYVTEATETTSPVWTGVASAIKGDVPALGRLVIDEDDAESQAWFLWGHRQQHYSSSTALTTARLFYEAEDLTPLGGGAGTASSGYGGTASGGGGAASDDTVIDADDLATDWEAVLGTTPVNLIGNYGFESNTTGWTAYDQGTVTVTMTRDAAYKYSGSYGVRIERTAGSAKHAGLYYSPTAVTPGAMYTFAMLVKGKDANIGTGGTVYVELLDSAGTVSTTSSTTFVWTGSWQFVTHTFTAGSGEVSVRPYVWCAEADTGDYFDADEANLASTAGSYEWTMQHTGAYRVWARVQSDSANTGIVGVRLEWGVGDFRNPTRNTATYLTSDRTSSGGAVENEWLLVDLGIVRIPQAVTGSQRWEGRLLAKSSVASDQLFVDYLMFQPVEEGAGEAAQGNVLAQSGGFSAYDGFDATSGALAGDTAPRGGVWAGVGDSDDFTASSSCVYRDFTSDTAPRIDYLPTTLSNVAAVSYQSITPGAAGGGGGPVIRYVDSTNYVYCRAIHDLSNACVTVTAAKVVGGSTTVLGTYQTDNAMLYNPGGTSSVGMHLLGIAALADGRWFVGIAPESGVPQLYFPTVVMSGSDSALVTGGTLDDGYVGLYDTNAGSESDTRYYYRFGAWVPEPDAAIFASASAEVRYDGVIREDSGGTYWQPVGSYRGDLLYVPPAGREAQPSQFLVKATRNDPRAGSDAGIDDISAALYVTPRFLTIPT